MTFKVGEEYLVVKTFVDDAHPTISIDKGEVLTCKALNKDDEVNVFFIILDKRYVFHNQYGHTRYIRPKDAYKFLKPLRKIATEKDYLCYRLTGNLPSEVWTRARKK